MGDPSERRSVSANWFADERHRDPEGRVAAPRLPQGLVARPELARGLGLPDQDAANIPEVTCSLLWACRSALSRPFPGLRAVLVNDTLYPDRWLQKPPPGRKGCVSQA